LGRDHQPYDKQPDQRTARQKSEAETRGQTNVNEGGESLRRVGRSRDSRLLIFGRLEASIPSEAMMHFPPVSDFPPIFEKFSDWKIF